MMSGSFRTWRRGVGNGEWGVGKRKKTPPTPHSPLPVFLPTRQPQPLQRVGGRIAGCGNLFLGLEAAHGFDGGLVVYAGQFAGVEASLLERLLNLERARPVDFEGLAPCRVSL